MAPVLPALCFLVVNAATLSAPSVPGTGRQEVLLSLDAPAALHLSARSAAGTSCTVIDRVRGPFATNGNVGGANCEVDLLLDAGQYKVRLESPKRGKGPVTISATPFQELNASAPRLIPGSGVLTTLKPRQQATFWISMKERGVPWVRISGRHAGDVRLWKNGEWLEPTQPWRQQFSPRPGQPMHEWWLDSQLEAGEYQLVVYGRDSTTITGSSVDDSLTVETGFRTGPVEHSIGFTLPASGVFAVAVPSDFFAGVLTLDSAPSSTVELQAIRANVRAASAACRIEKGSLAPECSTLIDGRGSLSALLVRGPPGTRGHLEWASYRSDGSVAGFGGYYGPSTTRLDFKASKGSYFVGVHDLPNDTDSAPLGCQLEQLVPNGDIAAIVARSVPSIGDGEKLEREFNYDSGAVIWFEVKGGNVFQRVGLSSRRFRIATRGGRKSTCEVYKVEDQGKLKRLSQSKAEGVECNELLALDPGIYQLQLSGGLSGVESLSIAPEGDPSAKAIVAKGGCVIPSVALENAFYRLTLNRQGTIAVRGLTVQPLPLTASEPLHLQLDGKQTITVPIAFTSALTVRASGGTAFGCALKAGALPKSGNDCNVPAATDMLTLTNPGDQPVNLTLSRPGAVPALSSPVSYQPTLTPMARITPDVPTFFDFGVNQTQAVMFDVAAAGLYNVTTQGLLSTDCRLRTPVIDDVAQNQGGGRGRNCLIQTYLQKGRYLFTATTTGSSKGRGAMTLSKRPVREFAGITGEGEQYFRVEGNDLVQQKLTVKAEGPYELGTSSQSSSSMLCRIDDPEGWPIEAVPSACVGTRELKAGTYLWTQLPLTVESMRRTQLRKVRPAVTLTGNKPHKVEYFTWYTAELGTDGKDEFLFNLEGETQLDVVLTGGMQGRIFLLEKDKTPKAVEVVPPMQPSDSGEGDSYESESGEGEQEAPPEREGEYSEGEGEEAEPQTAPVEVAQARAAPPPPSGVKLTLPAGQYKLLTEHSRGDVGVTYQLHFGSATLLPGMTRVLPAPSIIPLLIPRDGTLRLRTEGEVDVRCRLLDEKGRLVFEGSENGSDWNCAVAEPVLKGKYTLLLESETQRPGETKLTVSLPTVEDKGPLVEGTKLTLAGAVVSFAVPLAEKDAVQEISVRAQGKTPLSCALETAEGFVLHRKSRVSDCTLLVRPQLQKFRVRLWTTDGSAAVITSLRTRPISTASAGTVSGDSASAVNIPRAGRYRTSAQIFCIGGTETGLLRACGPEVSLEAGSTVFSGVGTKPQPLPLDENVASADDKAISLPLSRQPFVQVVKAGAKSIFLIEARVQHGERAGPSCAFDGAGAVRERRDASCFAASRAGMETTSRLWSPSEQDIDTRVVRRAVTLPEKAEALTTGRKRVTFKDVGRFSLPKNSRARLEVTLPKDAWAVLIDDAGGAMDLCAPTGDLRRCVLTGQGGSVVLISPAGQADVTTVLLEGGAPAVAFTGLYEDSPRTPGTVRLSVPPNDSERMATVDGALRCTIALSDGTRVASCKVKVPAKSGAELLIEHGVGPLRAMVHTPGREKWARMGIELPVVPGAALTSSVAVPLQSGRIDRTLVLDKEAVVRVAAESGVCGLFRGNDLLSVDGLDTGCELVRVLSPGTYRLLVRPFAGRVQPGSLRWTADPVTQLAEGVSAEDWLAPGEVRLFRFDTANKGKLGLGVQAKSELLECAVYNDGYQLVGEGCHQYLALDKGRFLLTVRNPPAPGAVPLAFKPVLLGLSGEKNDVPEEYLREFFGRVGVSR
ncbi:MAG: hypothetical protein Q8K32_13125 [Archangium sp.]|nr:hypothetical protein [Archangium sp.]